MPESIKDLLLHTWDNLHRPGEPRLCLGSERVEVLDNLALGIFEDLKGVVLVSVC